MYQDILQTQQEIFKLKITVDADADLTPIQDEMDHPHYSILTAQRKVIEIEQSNSSTPSLDSQQRNETQVNLPKLQIQALPILKSGLTLRICFLPLFSYMAMISKSFKTNEPHNLIFAYILKGSPTATNYTFVWEQLLSRYGDKRWLAVHY